LGSEATIQFEKIQKYLQDQRGDAAVRKFTRRTFEFLSLLDKHPFISLLEFPEKDIRCVNTTNKNPLQSQL
jgi:hypothetical protein